MTCSKLLLQLLTFFEGEVYHILCSTTRLVLQCRDVKDNTDFTRWYEIPAD